MKKKEERCDRNMKANKKTDSPIILDFGKDTTKVYLDVESEDEVQQEGN